MSDIRSFFGGSSAPSKKAATPPPKKGGGSPAKKGGAAGSQGSPAKLPAKPKAAPAPKPATAPAFKAAAPAPKAADDDDLMEIDTADFFGGGKATPKVLAARAATSPAMIKVEAGEQPKSASKRERKLPVAEPPAKMPCLSPHPAATSEPAAAASGAVGGARECLRSCVLVFTGEFPEIGSREAAEDYAKEWGGKVTSAVSGRTTYLVRGHDHGDPGKLQEGTKVSEAESKGVPTLSEQQLLALVRDAASGKLPERVRDAQKKSDEASAKAIKAAGKAAAKLPSPPRRSATAAGKQPAGGAAPAAPRGEREPSSLWTDIYAPKSFDELVGNQAAAKKLQEWLREFAAGRCKPNERAALLSGPPGIGKTTAAKLATKLAGLDAVEFNASDVRSKGAIKQYTASMTDNHTLLDYQIGGGGAGKAGAKPSGSAGGRGRMALIMDEVDGMGGGDRGGMAEMIQVIKSTRVPIICICNDRQDQKVRSLSNYCVDIRFQRPQADAIAKRMMVIAAKESVPMEPQALRKVAEVARADIRQVLNVLQMWRPSAAALAKGPAQPLGFREVNERLGTAKKDCALNVFDFAPKFFTPGTMTVEDRLRLYFADDLVPLFVQEMYHQRSPSRCPKGDELRHLHLIASAANSIAEGDCVQTCVMRQQKWELAPFCGIMSSVAPGFIMQSLSGGQCRFPTWLGKHSSAGKNARLARDLHTHMMAHTSAGKLQTLLCYLPALYQALTAPLAKGVAGIDEAVDVMMAYGLDKDDFEAVLAFLDLLATKGKDGTAINERGGVPSSVFESLDRATKTAFTKRYNERRPGETHKVKKTSAAAEAQRGDGVDDDEDAPAKDEAGALDEPEEEDDDDDVKNDRLVKAKKPKAAAKKSGGKRASGEGAGSGGKKAKK